MEAALKRAEHAEALLRDSLDGVAEGVARYGREGRFVICNDHFLEAYEQTHETMAEGNRPFVKCAALQTEIIVAIS